jgi:hypothetical protein
MWIKSVAVLLLSAVCISSGMMWRNEEHLKNRQHVLLFLGRALN